MMRRFANRYTVDLSGLTDRSNFCTITRYIKELTERLDASGNAKASGDFLYNINTPAEDFSVKGSLARSCRKSKFIISTTMALFTIAAVIMGFISVKYFLGRYEFMSYLMPFVAILVAAMPWIGFFIGERHAYKLTFNPLMKNILVYSRNHRDYNFYVDGVNYEGFFIHMVDDSGEKHSQYVSFCNLDIRQDVDENLCDPVFVVKRNKIKKVILPSYDRFAHIYGPIWEYYDVRDTDNNRIYA